MQLPFKSTHTRLPHNMVVEMKTLKMFYQARVNFKLEYGDEVYK